MPLHIQALLLRRIQHVEHPLLALRHRQKVHDLGQPCHTGQLCQTVHRAGVKFRPGIFQPRHRRHAGGDVHKLTHGQILRRVVHVDHRLLPQHIGNLVGVGHHRRGAVGHHGRRKGARREHGALDVDVRVHKARRQIGPLPVDHLVCQRRVGPAALLHIGHKPVQNIDHRRVNLPGEHIDKAHVFHR